MRCLKFHEDSIPNFQLDFFFFLHMTCITSKHHISFFKCWGMKLGYLFIIFKVKQNSKAKVFLGMCMPLHMYGSSFDWKSIGWPNNEDIQLIIFTIFSTMIIYQVRKWERRSLTSIILELSIYVRGYYINLGLSALSLWHKHRNLVFLFKANE